MTNENEFEGKLAERTPRRAYEAPTIRDFFQPLVVLGTIAPVGPGCENVKSKPPKH